MKKKPNVIFFAPILEYPPKGGPQLSVINAIKVLSKITNLYIVTSVNKDMLDSISKEFLDKHSSKCIFSSSSKIFTKKLMSWKHSRKFKRLLNPISCLVDALSIIKISKKEKIEIIWIDRVIEHAFFLFFYIKIFSYKKKVIADTETVYSDFILRELPFINNKLRFFYIFLRGKFAQLQEKIMLKNADVITSVSELDQNHYQLHTKFKSKVRLFSNVVDLEDYTKMENSKIQIEKPYLILMGSFGNKNSPMDRAAKWLVEDIMPIVWKKIPSVNLCIVGRNSNLTQSHLKSSRVHVLGKVPYMLPYLKNASASLVPLVYESGTRFKIIESGAASIPCISTSLGAEGLDVTDGKNIIIANKTLDFAEAIIKILKDDKLALNMSKELHNLIKLKYSLSKQTKEGQDIIDFVIGESHE